MGQVTKRLMADPQRSLKLLTDFLSANRMVNSGTADWNDLRMWSRWIGKFPWLCRPRRFTDVVMSYDPHLELEPMRRAQMIGGGRGRYNLNAYRCGTLNGVPVFEKIYLLHSEGWCRVDWAHSSVLPQLAGRVRTPRLLHRVAGQRLGAVYFEQLQDTNPVSVAVALDTATAFQRQFADLDISSVQKALTDFQADFLYSRGVTKLEALLARVGRDPTQVVEVAHSLLVPDIPRVFTHGDLVPGNMMTDGTVIDWDRCGAYPVGYEFARTMSDTVHCDDLAAFEAAVSGDIERTCAAVPGALQFFAAVFYARRARVQVSDALVLALFDQALILSGLKTPATRGCAQRSRYS